MERPNNPDTGAWYYHNEADKLPCGCAAGRLILVHNDDILPVLKNEYYEQALVCGCGDTWVVTFYVKQGVEMGWHVSRETIESDGRRISHDNRN